MKFAKVMGPLCAAGILFVASAGVVSFQTDREWQEIVAASEALELQRDSVQSVRPALHGELLPGKAFDEYTRAMDLLEADVLDQWILMRRAFRDGDPVARDLRRNLVAANRDALRALALGAHSEDPQHPAKMLGKRNSYLSFLRSRNLANVAMAAAQEHLDGGRFALAAEQVLDAMQFGQDTLASPIMIETMIGSALLAICTSEAVLDEVNDDCRMLDSFPPEQLALLEQAFEQLDQRFPSSSALADLELVYFVQTAEEGASYQELTGELPHDWMDRVTLGAFEERWILERAQELQRTQAFRKRSEGKSWLPWCGALARARKSAWSETFLSKGNRLMIEQSFEQTLRGTRALLRLTHAAVQYRLYGEVQSMADPFGGELEVSADAGVLQLRFEGPGGERCAARYTKTIGI